MPVDSKVNESLKAKEDFIRSAFTFKECTKFVASTSFGASTPRCGCGEVENNHYSDDASATPGRRWSEDVIRTIGPTNAFGVVRFFSGAHDLHKCAEFVRLSDDDDPPNVIELMGRYWGLLENEPPLLCISVIGGVDVFSLEGKKRDLFCEQPRAHYLKYCIGNAKRQDEAASLDKNHTHYILVDDGFRNSSRCNGARRFRKELEGLIATPRRDGGCGLPVVRIIVGGDYDILEQAAQSTQVGVPIVVCAGTGKAADILDRALRFWSVNKSLKGFTSSQVSELREMLAVLLRDGEANHRDAEWMVDQGIDLLATTMQHGDFVSCFDLGDECVGESLDRAILYALIKCSTTNPVDQLMVALKFGRIDVVKEKILPDGVGRLRSSTKALLHRLESNDFLPNHQVHHAYSQLPPDDPLACRGQEQCSREEEFHFFNVFLPPHWPVSGQPQKYKLTTTIPRLGLKHQMILFPNSR
ncbi:Transient receptor potential cation channel trpm [Taenia solium]|eukprot:TsM_001127100 transcript=TsM_001127100 gene=TsM_001127100